MKEHRIDTYRFLLVLLVVFIHMKGRGTIDYPGASEFHFYNGIEGFFTSTLPIIALPGLFAISGYLFFSNVELFDRKVYIGKIKRRAFSLLIPYIIWNFAKIAISSLVAYRGHGVEGVSEMFTTNGGWRIIWDGGPNNHCPILIGTWYIRDLMVMSLLCPAIYVLARKLHLLLWFIIVACGYMNVWPTEYICAAHYFSFFVLGATIAIHRVNICRINVSNVVLSVFALICLCATQYLDSYIFQYIAILSVLYSLSHIIDSLGSPISKGVSSSTTFIYLGHDLYFLYIVTIITQHIIPYPGEIWSLLRFFIIYIVTVGLLILIYSVIKKHIPRLISIILGGR